MRIALFSAFFSSLFFCVLGCDQGGSEPVATPKSELEQYIADNPEAVAAQAAIDAANDAEVEEDD